MPKCKGCGNTISEFSVQKYEGNCRFCYFMLECASPKKTPPLGVMPTKVWKYKRMVELADAIKRNIEYGFLQDEYELCLLEWLLELQDLIDDGMNAVSTP